MLLPLSILQMRVFGAWPAFCVSFSFVAGGVLFNAHAANYFLPPAVAAAITTAVATAITAALATAITETTPVSMSFSITGGLTSSDRAAFAFAVP